LAELVAPWFVFGPRKVRHVAGAVIVLFQAVLILSGNLSFLNWLTIVPALACFDDSLWARILPGRLVAAADGPSSAHGRAGRWPWRPGRSPRSVAVLSVKPVANLFSPARS
jgi:hypothetical protein